MIKIAFLEEYPNVIPVLVLWFRTQWPEYYAERTALDIAQDFYAETNRTDLPVRLVAFLNRELVGTITLREHAIRDLPEYKPGLGGLLVVSPFRNQGVGTALVEAGMKLAREQGYESIYATTVAASGILERLGWRLVQKIWHGDEQLALYRCALKKTSICQ